MTLRPNDKRALALLPVGLLIILLLYRTSAPPAVVVGAESPDLLEARLQKLRRTAATVPARRQILKSLQDQLALREKGAMNFATAPEAQAHLVEVLHRIGVQNKIEPRGSDFTPPSLLGSDYGQVAVSVSFETTIDGFVNFLSDLSREPELIAPTEVHITQGNLKNKTVNVRLTLAGIVPRKLVPEKKGFAAL